MSFRNYIDTATRKLSTTEKRLIELYTRRKAVRGMIQSTHHAVESGGRVRIKANLEPWAIARRKELWPVLDDLNSQIRQLKNEVDEEED